MFLLSGHLLSLEGKDTLSKQSVQEDGPNGDLPKSLKGRGFGASGSSFSFYRCDLRELLCLYKQTYWIFRVGVLLGSIQVPATSNMGTKG